MELFGVTFEDAFGDNLLMLFLWGMLCGFVLYAGPLLVVRTLRSTLTSTIGVPR